jgi:hypothetical protein
LFCARFSRRAALRNSFSRCCFKISAFSASSIAFAFSASSFARFSVSLLSRAYLARALKTAHVLQKPFLDFTIISKS